MFEHSLVNPELDSHRATQQEELFSLLPLVEDVNAAVQALEDAYLLGEYDCGIYIGAELSSEQLGVVKRIVCSQFRESRFNGALSGITFMSCSLEEVDFTNADLSGVFFLGPKLENLDKGVNTDTPWPSYKNILWPAQLDSVLFQEIYAPQGLDFSGGEAGRPRALRRVRFVDCRAPRSDFSDVVLVDVCFAGSSLTSSSFDRAVLSGYLQQVNLSRSSLQGARLAADLSEADLSCCDLAGADLTESVLRKANLSLTDLRDVGLPRDLREVRFFAVNLTDVDLSDKDLRGASLSYVEGLRTDLLPADLSGMHFEGIDLTRVDLLSRQERGLLRGTVFENCDLPPNFHPLSRSIPEDASQNRLDQAEVMKQFVEPPESITKIASVPLNLELTYEETGYYQSLYELKARICSSLFAIVDQEMTLYSLHRQIVSSPNHTHQIHLVRLNDQVLVGRTVDPEIRERGRFRELVFRADGSSGEIVTTKMSYLPHRSRVPDVREIEGTLYEQLALDINRIYTLYGVIPGTKGHVLWKKDLVTGERNLRSIRDFLWEDDTAGIVILKKLRGME